MENKHFEAIRYWSTKDAEYTLKGEHAHGRQARIRLNLIKRMPLSDKEKRNLYQKYCEQLLTKINSIPGIRVYGTMPAFD